MCGDMCLVISSRPSGPASEKKQKTTKIIIWRIVFLLSTQQFRISLRYYYYYLVYSGGRPRIPQVGRPPEPSKGRVYTIRYYVRRRARTRPTNRRWHSIRLHDAPDLSTMRWLVCNTSVMCERVESVIFRIHQYVEEEKED